MVALVRQRRLSTQILWLQLGILVITLLVGLGLSLRALRQELDRDFELQALRVAQSVAADPQIAPAILGRDPHGMVQRRAEAVRRETGALFVVVTDDRGIRYSHPNPARIGQRVSTDPGPALSGRTVMAIEKGTLGRSARGKVPLRAAGGRIVGEVSVGIAEDRISRRLLGLLPSTLAYTAVSLTVGVVASFLLARRLKRQTFGLELSEIAALLQEREATLHGIREGVVALGRDRRLVVLNDEARRLLGLGEESLGRRLADLPLPGRVREVMGRDHVEDQLALVGDHVLVLNSRPVTLNGSDLGTVVTLRDRTELEALLRELDSVRGLSEALRTQAHEHSNRLHTLVGLLQLGLYDDAIGYITELAAGHDALARDLSTRVRDKLIAALLLAETLVASERRVDLRLEPDSQIPGPLRAPLDVHSVLGNLISNAIDAAAAGDREPAWVEVRLRCKGEDLWIRVRDSGPGVPAAAASQVFEDGFSTKPQPAVGQRGLGLALVSQIARRHGGQARLAEPCPGEGACFEVVLRGVLEGEPARDQDAMAPP
jgi:two-component system CitB family sensor kinase